MFYKIMIFFLMLLTIQSNSLFAATTVPIDVTNSSINIAIKYSVVGHYKATFKMYSGNIKFDEQTRQIQSVSLAIQAASINSGFDFMDKVVRSRQLLDTTKIPLITFESKSVIKDQFGYQVKGILAIHGVNKEYTFPFNVNETRDDVRKINQTVLNGKWVVNRKDFGVIWNKLLDHGGVLVGDYITVNWVVRY